MVLIEAESDSKPLRDELLRLLCEGVAIFVDDGVLAPVPEPQALTPPLRDMDGKLVCEGDVREESVAEGDPAALPDALLEAESDPAPLCEALPRLLCESETRVVGDALNAADSDAALLALALARAVRLAAAEPGSVAAELTVPQTLTEALARGDGEARAEAHEETDAEMEAVEEDERLTEGVALGEASCDALLRLDPDGMAARDCETLAPSDAEGGIDALCGTDADAEAVLEADRQTEGLPERVAAPASEELATLDEEGEPAALAQALPLPPPLFAEPVAIALVGSAEGDKDAAPLELGVCELLPLCVAARVVGAELCDSVAAVDAVAAREEGAPLRVPEAQAEALPGAGLNEAPTLPLKEANTVAEPVLQSLREPVPEADCVSPKDADAALEVGPGV